MHVSRRRVLLASPVAGARSSRRAPQPSPRRAKETLAPANEPSSFLLATDKAWPLGDCMVLSLLASLAASVECSLPKSPPSQGHQGSNGLLMSEPKLNPNNHVWRDLWADAGLFLDRRAALQSLGNPAVYTKTAHERSIKRRPPTIDTIASTDYLTNPASSKESPGQRPRHGKSASDGSICGADQSPRAVTSRSRQGKSD